VSKLPSSLGANNEVLTTILLVISVINPPPKKANPAVALIKGVTGFSFLEKHSISYQPEVSNHELIFYGRGVPKNLLDPQIPKGTIKDRNLLIR
jgi:hypothetical protein